MGQDYYVMFFKHEHPFEEFFSISMNLLKKTWREMHPAVVDKSRVRECWDLVEMRKCIKIRFCWKIYWWGGGGGEMGREHD